MQFRRTPPEAAQVNMTPLIDVVFLLLIFFMVSTHFPDRQLPLDLPNAATGEVERLETDLLLVSLDASGQLLLNGQPLVEEELESQLMEGMQRMQQPTLIIQADRHTPHQQVVLVLDTARRLGLSRVRIATHEPSP